MKRTRYVWTAFALCFCVAAAAMAWISAAALRLDRAERAARRQAAFEENVRLALWRMDSALAPLVARESARPYFAYGAFLPIERSYAGMFNRGESGEALQPSPLVGRLPPHVQVYFQFEPDGSLTSPGIPRGANYDLAVPKYLAPETVAATRATIARLGKLTDRERLMAALPKNAAAPLEPLYSPLPIDRQQLESQARNRASRQGPDRGANEFAVRNQAVMQQTSAILAQPTDVGGVVMTPLWIGDRLALARRVTVRGREYVQGCLLDWPALKSWLLDEVADLLPAADLAPLAGEISRQQSRRLAALPLEFLPGSAEADSNAADSQATASGAAATNRNLSPIEISLLVAWSCILLAAAAVAFLLLGVVRLGERRAAFVSAVTHELRTPLTTFKMYAEMLADGMVSDPEKRREYLQILRAEADRLGHMVENVLSYARLENGRPGGRMEDVALGSLLEQTQGRLADRAARAGMCLTLNVDDSLRAVAVRANPSAVDQILFNLVDNACKYAVNPTAATDDDRRITISAHRAGNSLEIRVRDCGPGIGPAAAARLFRGFSKSAGEAAVTAPGIGLGLALSRRLARDMGGSLRLHAPSGSENVGSTGACFVLTLKIPP